jgi:hypothetical protein
MLVRYFLTGEPWATVWFTTILTFPSGKVCLFWKCIINFWGRAWLCIADYSRESYQHCGDVRNPIICVVNIFGCQLLIGSFVISCLVSTEILTGLPVVSSDARDHRSPSIHAPYYSGTIRSPQRYQTPLGNDSSHYHWWQLNSSSGRVVTLTNGPVPLIVVARRP